MKQLQKVNISLLCHEDEEQHFWDKCSYITQNAIMRIYLNVLVCNNAAASLY